MDNTYIEQQIKAINEWERRKPSAVEQGISSLLAPVHSVASRVIPEQIVEAALTKACAIGKTLARKGDIISDGEVESIADLRYKDLELSDEIADSVHNWAIGTAASEGFATGMGGAAAMAADISFLITFAFRTIHRIGMCYGYEVKTDDDERFVLGILSVSSANTINERKAALLALKADIRAGGFVARKVLMSDLIKNLAKQMGINLTKRKMAQLVPLIGAGLGAAMNYSFITDIAWAARRAYQQRWLADNGYRNINVEV